MVNTCQCEKRCGLVKVSADQEQCDSSSGKGDQRADMRPDHGEVRRGGRTSPVLRDREVAGAKMANQGLTQRSMVSVVGLFDVPWPRVFSREYSESVDSELSRQSEMLLNND